jgi:hypothetical protein
MKTGKKLPTAIKQAWEFKYSKKEKPTEIGLAHLFRYSYNPFTNTRFIFVF